MNRYRGIFFPVLLIALGLLALLANLGAVTWDQLARVFDLWPLLLIVLGILLILRRLTSPPVATGVGAAVAILAVVAAIAYVAAGPGVGVGAATGTASAPLGSAGTGTLDVSGGGVRFTARAGDTGSDLYRATYSAPAGEAPSFQNQNGKVSVDFSNHHHFFFGGFGQRSLDMTLSTQVPWTLDLSGGGFNADVDLSAGHLKAMTVSGGGINLSSRLPAPQGTVPISVSGGGINANLHRPSGVEVRVSVSGGGSTIEADGNSFAALAGSRDWSSPGYSSATDRYDISAEGGGCNVSVDSSG